MTKKTTKNKQGKSGKPKKNKSLAKRNKQELSKAIFSVLNEHPEKSFNYKQIAAKLHITDSPRRDMLVKQLTQLTEKKRIAVVNTKPSQYAIIMKAYSM